MYTVGVLQSLQISQSSVPWISSGIMEAYKRDSLRTYLSLVNNAVLECEDEELQRETWFAWQIRFRKALNWLSYHLVISIKKHHSSPNINSPMEAWRWSCPRSFILQEGSGGGASRVVQMGSVIWKKYVASLRYLAHIIVWTSTKNKQKSMWKACICTPLTSILFKQSLQHGSHSVPFILGYLERHSYPIEPWTDAHQMQGIVDVVTFGRL